MASVPANTPSVLIRAQGMRRPSTSGIFVRQLCAWEQVLGRAYEKCADLSTSCSSSSESNNIAQQQRQRQQQLLNAHCIAFQVGKWKKWKTRIAQGDHRAKWKEAERGRRKARALRRGFMFRTVGN